MTIKSHVETAEEALRQAIINSLAEKQDTHLSDLFAALNTVKGLLNKLQTPSYKFNLTSDYLSTGEVKYNFTGADQNGYGTDVISFGSRPYNFSDVISFG